MFFEFIVLSITFIIVSSVYFYWTIVLARKIYLSGMYKRVALRNITNMESDYVSEQYYYHHHTEMYKFTFLLLLNLIEMFTYSQHMIHLGLEDFSHKDSYRSQLLNCTYTNYSDLIDFQLKEDTIPILYISRTLADITSLFVPSLGICMMDFLIKRMKHTKRPTGIRIKRFFSILFLLSVAILLLSCSRVVEILCKVVFLTIFTVYFSIFIQQVRRFKQALLQVAIERLIQHGENSIEMRQYKYFEYSILPVSVGMGFVVIAFFIGIISRAMISFSFFSKCKFPSNLIPNFSTSIQLKHNELVTVFKTLFYMDRTSSVLACTGIALVTTPLYVYTCGIWIYKANKWMKGKSSLKIKYRGYSES